MDDTVTFSLLKSVGFFFPVFFNNNIMIIILDESIHSAYLQSSLYQQ